MPEELPIEVLNVPRDVASGQHMVEETVFSVPNDAAMADDQECKTPGSQFHIKVTPKEIGGIVDLPFEVELSEEEAKKMEDKIHDALEDILEPLFKKDAMGLLDIPASIDGGEVLDFSGIPQPPGLSRELGDDEETDYFGASEEGVDLPPENHKHQDDPGEKIYRGELDAMFKELEKLEAFLNQSGKTSKAKAVLKLKKEAGGVGAATGVLVGLSAPAIFPPAMLVPPSLRMMLGGYAGHKLQEYLTSKPEKQKKVKSLGEMLQDTQSKLEGFGVKQPELDGLLDGTLSPGEVAKRYPEHEKEIIGYSSQYIGQAKTVEAVTKAEAAAASAGQSGSAGRAAPSSGWQTYLSRGGVWAEFAKAWAESPPEGYDASFSSFVSWYNANGKPRVEQALEMISTPKETSPEESAPQEVEGLSEEELQVNDSVPPLEGETEGAGAEKTQVGIGVEKKRRIMTELGLDEEWFSEWASKEFPFVRGPAVIGEREVAIADFGEELPADIRYDGVVKGEDGVWMVAPLSRKERKELEMKGRENKTLRQEMRREDRSVRREERQRQRMRRREDRRDERRQRARKESRRMQIEGLHKIATSK